MTFPVVVQALWGPISIDADGIESAVHTRIGGDNVRLNMAGGGFITITAGSARALRTIGVACLDDSPPNLQGRTPRTIPECHSAIFGETISCRGVCELVPDAQLTALLDELDKAKAEVERLFKEALGKPIDEALHQRFWDSTERENLARRAVLKHTGG